MHSTLIEPYIDVLQLASKQAPVLDLACGFGRNGLYLLDHEIDVVFADLNKPSLQTIKQSLKPNISALAEFWAVDFEQEVFDQETLIPNNLEISPLQGKQFSAIMVFRYLHRPLFEQIKQAIMPGGFIVYETFTLEQAQFGRPKNPDFLLKPGELMGVFSSWKIMHTFEGIVENGQTKQAIAQIVAQKPL